MAQEVDVKDSILLCTKKILGISADYDVFDVDVITHINTVFADLLQLGIGPENGYEIEDETALWSDYLGDNLRFGMVKSYMYLRVQSLFDPPATGFHLEARQKQIDKMEWRINVARETTDWVDPNPPPVPVDDPFADGP